MYDVGLKTQMFEQGEGSAREESETNVIVVVTVDCRAREELVRFEQVRRRSRGIAIPETNVMNLPAPLDANVLDRAAVQTARDRPVHRAGG